MSSITSVSPRGFSRDHQNEMVTLQNKICHIQYTIRKTVIAEM